MLAGWRGWGPLVALLALLVFNAAFTPGFAAVEVRDGRLFGAVIDILKNGATVMLLATGMTLVIAAGGIDLSVGSVMALSATAAALGLAEHGVGPGAAFALGLVVGAAAGVVNGVLVTAAGLQPIIATLVVLVAARGGAQMLTGDQKVTFESPGFEWLGTGAVAGIPVPVVIAGIVGAAAMAATRWTVLGLYTRAIGESERAARLCGIPVRGVRLGTYVLSGACAAVAGMIGAADIGVADVSNAGLYLELDAILAVVIGGTPLTGGKPRLFGALVGALIMQTLTVMLQMHGAPTEHALVVKAVAVLLVCAAQAPGLARIWARVAGGRA